MRFYKSEETKVRTTHSRFSKLENRKKHCFLGVKFPRKNVQGQKKKRQGIESFFSQERYY